MLRSNADAISAGLIALATALPLLTIAKGGEAAPARYWRSTAPYTIRSGGDCYDVARRLRQTYGVPKPGMDTWFVAQEVARLNWVTPDALLPKGHKLTVPIYRPSSKSFCGDLRNWQVAVFAGQTFGVSPALLIAVRSHENPKRSRDWYAYGVVKVKGTDLRTQARWGAIIICRIAGRQGWSPMKPTRAGVTRLGKVYTGTGSTSWGKCVWAHYQKARGR